MVNTEFLRFFKKISWIIVFISAIFQVLLFSTYENIFGVICVLIGWKLTDTFVLNHSKIHRYTLSSVSILGYSMTQLFFPLMFTLIENKPIVYNLELPYDVFTHIILGLIVLLLSHAVYIIYFPKILYNKIQNVLIKFKIFQVPSENQMWVMGIFGLIAIYITFFYYKNTYEMSNEGGIGVKFLEGLIPFAYIPFFLRISKLYSFIEGKHKLDRLKFTVFVVTLLILGIGSNSRGTFLICFVALGLSIFLGLLLGKFKFKVLSTPKILFISLITWLVLIPLPDLLTAMVMVRSQRGDLSKDELINNTIDAFEDKERLELFRKITLKTIENKGSWDESYFDNIFLSRFCNLKYNDLSLLAANKIGPEDDEMKKYSINKALSILPNPILEFLSIGIDKNDVLSSSFGDYIYFISDHSISINKGYKTGHFAGTGMASFGWWYLLLLSIASIVSFFLLDLLVLHLNSNLALLNQEFISVIALISLYNFFTFFGSSESVVNLYMFLIRGWVQLVFLYIIIFFVARKLVQ